MRIFSLNKITNCWDRLIRIILNLVILEALEFFNFVLSGVKFNNVSAWIDLVILFLPLG